MFKRFKNIALLTIVCIYAIQLLPYFSDTIYEKVKTYRQERQLTKFHLRETKHITLKSWNSIKNKKEFKINGVFYDVFSHSIEKGGIVKLVAFKDTQENKLHLFFNHFLKKDYPNSKDKKKTTQKKLPYLTLEEEIAINNLFSNESNFIENFATKEGKTINIVTAILKPPLTV
ncbi:MAG: hypothetical protein V4670_10040 [Bacteroidota bacterium]